MNLETLSSPGGDRGAACSLSSLLALGCRSRAEAAHSFAKKLHTKLWSLSPSQSTTDAELSSVSQYRERKDDYSSWTVEARFDLNSKRVETVVTSVPLITSNRQIANLSCVVYQPPDYQFNQFSADSSPDELASMGSHTNFNSRSALDGSWGNFQKGHEVLSARTHDQESETSSSTTTNTMSDSDQYFDFGIETPVDLDSAGEETVSHELPIVINREDGLPVRQTDGMESGFIFGSPILSGEEDSDQLEDREEEPSFYESLSQSPASAPFAHKPNLDRFNFGQPSAHVCEPVLDLSGDVNTTDMEVSGHNGGVQVEEETPPSNTIDDCTQAQSEPVGTSPHEKVARADLGFEGDIEVVESNFSTGDMALSEPLQSEITHSSPPASPGSFVSTLGEVPPDSPPDAREDACRFQAADVLADLLKLKLDMVRLDPVITDQLFNVSAEENNTVLRPNNLSIELEKNTNDRYVVGDDNVVAKAAALLMCVIDSNPKAEADDESNVTSSSSEVTSTKESTPSKEDEDEEQTPDDEVDSKLYRSRVQRSTSLKTCKTPPGTPGRKKIVRFADALGLDLALVRTFLDEVPNVPQSAFSDLTDVPSQGDSCPIRTNQAQPGSYIRITRRDPSTNSSVTTFVSSPRILVANFTQPGNMADFVERVKRQKISLETASMIDDSRLRGVVRVLNIDFHKSVLVRFTIDEWRTQSDQLATYVPNSCDGLSDRFTFNLAGAQSMQPGQRLIFAICYRVAGQEIWDSNQGRNYVFQCISNSNYLPSIALNNPTVSDAFLPYM